MQTVAKERDSSPTSPGEQRTRRPVRGGLRMGRLFGIDIVADWSLLIIFALVAVNLGLGVFPGWHPTWSTALVWVVAVGAAVLFFASVLVHELSHAIVGRMNGIPVRRITLFIFGGMAHMEGEPPSPKSEFLMAVVGPITSIVIGVVSVMVAGALAGPELAAATDDPVAAMRNMGPVATLLMWLGPINVLLGLFNLVPGFPLDGGRVFRAILWAVTKDLKKATRWAANVGRLVSWALMGLGVTMMLTGGFGQGLWLIIIGWFLNSAARMSYQQLVVREGLRGVSVSEVMRPGGQTVPVNMSVDRLVREHMLAGAQDCWPVTSGEELAGLVCLQDVRRVPQERWADTPVADVMTPLGELKVAEPDEPAAKALEALGRGKMEQLPVVRDGHLLGLVRQQDILRWLTIHAEELPA